jgi:hypothetical protein
LDDYYYSAQKDTYAYSAAAKNNSRYGFDMKLEDYYGATGMNIWTSWIALGFKQRFINVSSGNPGLTFQFDYLFLECRLDIFFKAIKQLTNL